MYRISQICTFRGALLGGVTLFALSGCSLIPSSGPSRSQVESANQEYKGSEIPVVDLTGDVVQNLSSASKHDAFSQAFIADHSPSYVMGPGDVVQVSIWEAPPAVLFGMAGIGQGTRAAGAGMGATTAGPATFPEQMVAADGTINVPFAGNVAVAGKTPQQVEGEIADRLKDMANQPQVMLRVVRNATSVVTVVGEVNQNTSMPLTAKGERLLDAIAAAGGVKQPVGKMTVRVTRGNAAHAMPLEAVIQDPKENVVLQPGDVVTALFQPNSFTALGAVVKNDEVSFEAQGITLAQALGRVGGPDDTRADAKGAFIFRFEEKDVAVTVTGRKEKDLPVTPDGRVPIVYRVDLKEPAMFLLAQNFPMHNKDVIYIANAPVAQLQKFLNIIVSTIMPVGTLKTVGAFR